jgi:ABC-type uncharacterized transport system permease subunit
VIDEFFNFSYPVPGIMYQGFLRILFYVILSYGLLYTIPTQFFTEGLPVGMWFLFVGAAYGRFTIFLWKRGVRRYNSANA